MATLNLGKIVQATLNKPISLKDPVLTVIFRSGDNLQEYTFIADAENKRVLSNLRDDIDEFLNGAKER